MTIWKDTALPASTRIESLRQQYLNDLKEAKMEAAHTHATNALRFAIEHEMEKEQLLALHALGETAARTGEYGLALDYFRQVKDQGQASADTLIWAEALKSEGNVYLRKSAYEFALDCYLRSMRLSQDFGNLPLQAKNCNNVGLIYMDLGNYVKAQEYLEQAYQINTDQQLLGQQANVLNNLGTVFRLQQDYEQALEYYQRSAELKEQTNYLYGIGVCYSNIGLVQSFLGYEQEALAWFERSYTAHREAEDKKGQANALIHLGKFYGQSEVDTAFALGHRALSLAQEIGSVEEVSDAASLLYQLNLAQDNSQAALEMFELFKRMQDSMLSLNNQRALLEHEFLASYAPQQDAATVREEGQLPTANLSSSRFVWALLLIVLIAFGWFIYSRYQYLVGRHNALSQEVDALRQKLLGQFSTKPTEKALTKLDRNKLEDAIETRLGESAWRILKLVLDNPAISNKEIAREMNLSLDGVSSSLRRIYAAFEVQGTGNKKVLLARKIVKIQTGTVEKHNN